ncbi:MAG TPA: CusA/CzcA family heavy metal efflux RND transporter [Nitrospiraceae bacterium]|nr:CusA/CzcA family heavy metal efflux RND transporter [Nitrospiraceae bacterium]
MVPRVVEFALSHRAMVSMFGALLLCGGLYAFHLLDIVAYPDPSPPMVEVITQNSALSSEEIERQITLPIEFALAAMPGLSHTRSISLFGLSDIKFYFDYDTDYFRDRQEVLSRLAFLGLPGGVQPAISPWWALAEVYRYELVGPHHNLTDLKTIQDWQLNREFKRVHGVIDVTAFGGTTRQYQVELDPGMLFSYGVSTPQIISAISASNANAGGNYLTIGAQSFDIRGVGLIRDLDDIENIMVAEKDGTPILVKNLGAVKTGYRVRLGKVGIDDRDDVVEGVVLVMRGYQSLPVLEQVKLKIEELNGGKLPDGIQIKPVYDRSVLIHTTIETVMDILLTGISFVFVTLFIFLGHFRTAVIVALAVPVALLFTFILMVAIGESANLVSLGAIDFGIIVDSTLLMVENVFYQLTHKRDPQASIKDHIVRAGHDVGRPIFFATAIIIVAFIPLFTMEGVPGKIFAPMSLTYGFALTGALIMAFTLAPVLCSWFLGTSLPKDTRLVEWIRRHYVRILSWSLDHHTIVMLFAVILLAGGLGLWFVLGGEFMPPLEEGNIWLRATMPIGISFEEAGRLVTDMRTVFRQYPESRTVVSQLGRPDDGTDPTSFFNAEFLVDLKPAKEWRPEFHTKAELIGQIEQELSKRFPGITLNFSQMIQDNVEEAMTGVKGENSVKVFGPDLAVLEDKANQIKAIMDHVTGVKDLGVLRSLGQPNLLIEVDRSATARYGIEVDDVNAVVQAAVGGQSVTQVFEGEKWFDLVVRFLPQFRTSAERIGDIQVITPGKSRIPLKQLATIKESVGPFMIYRENNQRYVPVKFSVRGRDLERTVKEAKRRIDEQIELPKGYRLEWHGEYSQLQAEKHRLATIVPLSVFVILLIVSYALQSLRDGLLVLAAVPFALVGGIIALFVTGTHFSISAAVGFLSVFGVAVQGALVDISRLHEYVEKGFDLKTAILKNAEVRMRPVMMTTLSAAIGLLPASVATGIGAQSQQPLARVVVGGMLSAVTLILLVLPVLYQWVHRRDHQPTTNRMAHGTVEP